MVASSILGNTRFMVPTHQITNIIYTFDLGRTNLALLKLYHRFDFITYNLSKFAAGIICNKKLKTSFLLFCTGVAMCTRAKMIQDACTGLLLLCNYFLKRDQHFVMTDFKV